MNGERRDHCPRAQVSSFTFKWLTGGLGDGSVRISSTQVKSGAWPHDPITLALGLGQPLGACHPASLAETVSFWFAERACLKARTIEEDTWHSPLYYTQTTTSAHSCVCNMQVCVYTCMHTHTERNIDAQK